jgi:hypothetical protein
MKTMMVRTRGPKKISEKMFQLEIGGFGGSPIGRMVHMSGSQDLRKNLKFTSKRKWLSDPIIMFFANLCKHNIPKLHRRSLEGKRNAKKEKKFPMSNPFPLKLAKPRWSCQERLVIEKHFMPLNGRARGLTESV